MPIEALGYLGGVQAKTAGSFSPDCWLDESVRNPKRDQDASKHWPRRSRSSNTAPRPTLGGRLLADRQGAEQLGVMAAFAGTRVAVRIEGSDARFREAPISPSMISAAVRLHRAETR